jgi:hypothetical protein
MCSTYTGDSARYVEITWPAYQYLCVGTETTVLDLESMEPECGLIRFVQNKNKSCTQANNFIFYKNGKFYFITKGPLGSKNESIRHVI